MKALGLADDPLLAERARYAAKVRDLCATPPKPAVCAAALARSRKD